MIATSRTIRAIPTTYAGCKFRSRLEARWAVFFDRLGIVWEYEAQGYLTAHGAYLPDFVLHLPSGPTFFEVKPPHAGPGWPEDPRWNDLTIDERDRIIVACGMPRPDSVPQDEHLYMFQGPSGDCSFAFCLCCACGAVGVEFDGRGARVCPGCECTHGNRDKCYSYDAPNISAAYVAARSARFEHGERG